MSWNEITEAQIHLNENIERKTISKYLTWTFNCTKNPMNIDNKTKTISLLFNWIVKSFFGSKQPSIQNEIAKLTNKKQTSKNQLAFSLIGRGI